LKTNEAAHIFGAIFPPENFLYWVRMTKREILGKIFTNSSGHPGWERPRISNANFKGLFLVRLPEKCKHKWDRIRWIFLFGYTTLHGCQMACFQTKNPNLGKFLRDVVGIFYCRFGLFYTHLVYVVVIWYILWLFGIWYGYLV
jgi:hypothetical protein